MEFKQGIILGMQYIFPAGLAALFILDNDSLKIQTVHVESGFGLRMLDVAFDGLHNIKGKEIRYTLDYGTLMKDFTPINN